MTASSSIHAHMCIRIHGMRAGGGRDAAATQADRTALLVGWTGVAGTEDGGHTAAREQSGYTSPGLGRTLQEDFLEERTAQPGREEGVVRSLEHGIVQRRP